MSLIKKIQNTIFEKNLFERGSKIVLGVSGGPDSVVMLDVFSKLVPKYDLELAVVHINYNLRGKDSEKDEKFVRSLCEKYLIKSSIFSEKVSKEDVSEKNLRDIRYTHFENIRKNSGFDFIAVAHSLDDQVETFLMRIVRGAGLTGLSAMKYKNGKIIRPLLGVSREEIMKYIKEHNLKYRIDKTNSESVFLRNKIRNKFIPILKREFNPRIKETIFNATRSIAEDADFLEYSGNKEYEKNKSLKINKLLNLHPALQRRLILKVIFSQKKNLRDIESKHIDEIIKAAKSTKGKNQIVLFQGLKITRKNDRLTIMNVKN